MRGRPWLTALAALACALAACSFDGAHGTGYKCVEDGDCPDGQRCVELACQRDDALGDGGGRGDGGAPADAGGNDLIQNGGFESADLGPWDDFSSTIARTTEASRSGSYSASVCGTDGEYFTAYQFLFHGDVPTGTYRASAYGRAAVGGPPVAMRLAIREDSDGDQENHDSDSQLVDDEWTPFEVTAVVDDPDLTWIQVIVWGLTKDDLCYLVDDVSVTLEP